MTQVRNACLEATCLNQPYPEPVGQLLVPRLSTGDADHYLHDRHVVLDELVAASFDQQFDKIQRRTLVPVHEAVAGDDPVKQSGSLLMDESMVAVIRARDSRPDRILAENARTAALGKRFVVAADRIGLCHAIMPPTDWRVPASPSAASPRFSR